MTLNEAQKKALKVRKLYEQLEAKRYGRSWTTEEIALGFVGDVGDLTKLILAHEGIRNIDNHKEKLGHELADCLWSILVIANRCDIDIEQEFTKTMDDLGQYVSGQLADS